MRVLPEVGMGNDHHRTAADSTIAAALNSRAAPSPRAQQGRPSGWSVSTIRDVLKRPLYRGASCGDGPRVPTGVNSARSR